MNCASVHAEDRWRHLLAGFAVLLMIAAVGLFGTSCSATPQRVASVTVVGLGGAVASLNDSSSAAYTTATNALRVGLVASRGSLADYTRESAPMTAAFNARGHAIEELDALLYVAASVIDSAGGNASAYLPALRRLVVAVDGALVVLADGTYLPAVSIPPAVTAAVAGLRALLGGDPDAG